MSDPTQLAMELREFADYWENLTHVVVPEYGMISRGNGHELLREAADVIEEWGKWQKVKA